MIRIATYLILILLFTQCKQDSQSTQETSRPNIVLIMADDMGYESLSVNGSTEYLTPNLDRLATQGIRFTNCYSQPLCTPSRVKIMTGKHNYRNYEDFGYLNPQEITFGNLLKNTGYKTMIAGKWQLNGLNRDNPDNQDIERPYEFGFDEYCLWQLNRTRAEGERFADPLITQNGKDLPRDPDAYGPRIFADYVIDFIERNSEEPFFIYYPMVLVHDPFVPTPDSEAWKDPARRYEKDTVYYADMMAYTDKIIGQIEAKLKEKGVWDNTLFLFTADNGTNVKIKSETTTGIVWGAKGKTINTGNHVPFIATWPDRIKQAAVFDGMVDFADFLPTLADAGGVAAKDYTSDGKSFYPFLAGQIKSTKDQVFIHYTPRWGSMDHDRWVMDNEYKLYQDGRFFRTSVDPLEQQPIENLSESELAIKNNFQKILDQKEADIPYALNDESFKVNQ
ncbi:MAG: sulfatase-like hydrolase/transferase [Bacteroidota bacterium]